MARRRQLHVDDFGDGARTRNGRAELIASSHAAAINDDLQMRIPDLQPEIDRQAQRSAFELELARAITEVINMELPPERIDPTAPIFGDEGLGLDSIDLLEVALVVSQRYGFSLRSDDPDNLRIFASLRNLAAHIERHRSK